MMFRILSIGGPLWVYATIAVLVYGVSRERKKFDWLALAPAAAGFLASVLFLSPVHRLFFDEDMYINVASNLTRAPVNQFTVMGSPGDIQVSTYQNVPAGWPVFLSFAFLAAGRSETVAFWFARLMFALAIAAIYQLARELLSTRRQAFLAAVFFGATPICFWFSVSTGTDLMAVSMAVLGVWGLVTGNGALAAGGLAFAAQTRMELLALIPLVWLSPKISPKWKIAAAAVVLFEVVHVAWVLSVTSVLEQAEAVSSAFGIGFVGRNLWENIKYIFNPLWFPAMVSVLVVIFLGKWILNRARRLLPGGGLLLFWIFALFGVYMAFYAGRFDMNPRYSIQILAPMTILAASFARRPAWLAVLFVSAIVPTIERYELAPFVQALQADHQFCVRFASQVDPGDLVVSGQQEIFIDQGRRAVNAAFASEGKIRLEDEIQRHVRVWYHSGVRANIPNSHEWLADRWVKSNFELHLIDSQRVSGFGIAFYELLLKNVDRDAR